MYLLLACYVRNLFRIDSFQLFSSLVKALDEFSPVKHVDDFVVIFALLPVQKATFIRIASVFWMFPNIVGEIPPKSSILIGVFHDFHHPFWGTVPLFLETPISTSRFLLIFRWKTLNMNQVLVTVDVTHHSQGFFSVGFGGLSGWGPLTTISGFIPSYTHLQSW